MLPSQSPPSDDEDVESQREHKFVIAPEIIEDYAFWEGLANIAQAAAEKHGINPFWRRAYAQLASACDVLSAMMYRNSQKDGYGP